MTTKTTAFRAALDEVFPGAIEEVSFVKRASFVLKSEGFNSENSIACVAVCRDELCDPFVSAVISSFGPTFGMRGLGGFISCGQTGFGAAHAHSPVVDGRQRFVYFVAPHIGIDDAGAIGKVGRPGISKKSSACGALCAFHAEIESGDVDLKLNMSDVEQCMLKQAMTPKLATGVSAFPCASGFKTTDLAGLTKLAESVIVTEQLQAMISATVNTTDADYAIVAGIQIHGPGGKTYFCQVPEHCVTCVKGSVSPLHIDSYALDDTSPVA